MKNILLLLFVLILSTSFQEKQLTWVAIGDSITYLNEHANGTDSRITKGYMTMVTEKLPHIKYVNQGHNGWTSGEIAEEIEKLGIVKADIYSIFLGTNDWWQGRPIGTLEDYKNDEGNNTVYGSFRIIVKKLRLLNPQAKIILITPMKRVDFVQVGNMNNHAWGSYKEKNGQTLEQFAKAVDSIAKFENFPVVDLFHTKGMDYKNLVKFKRLREPGKESYRDYKYPEFVNIAFNPGKDQYPYPPDAVDITYDGLHPSDKGYEILAKKLVKILKR
ncbi:MAG: SGNH/GDSL hydrolase family protein [Chitinophagaceae bacterium]|nr:SGNH/GDSL hydrolase family protein [Chitinophagaceae bacterium]